MKRLLRFSDLKERNIVRNWPTLLRWIDREEFPAGIKLAANTRVWEEADIDRWIEARAERDEAA